MQLPSTAEQKPHVLVQCEQRNLVASQLGGGVPTGKGWRPKQGFSMGQYGVRLWHAIRAQQARSTLKKLQVCTWSGVKTCPDGEELLP